MPVHDMIFWIVIMVALFILFLGAQLRFFGGMALKIYVQDKLRQASPAEVRDIILAAVGGLRAPHPEKAEHTALVDHLRADHPRPLAQIRLGRRITTLMPFVIALMLVARRFWPF
ncbi:MAG: hypothetical protein MRY64_07360 [Hyphomonadaceae bacterium]|nr:hypothetical protein [Hyphomonadaceae bacterium]